jgi:hypothetical protein
MKSYLLSLAVLACVLFVNSCKDKDEKAVQLDFRPVEAENVITPPDGLVRENNGFAGYTIACEQEVVFTISNINAALGVLTLVSYKHPTAANCNIKTEITRIDAPPAGETVRRFRKLERDLLPGPGGAFTEIMEVLAVDTIKVKIKCIGTAGGNCIFDLNFRSIKEADEDNPPPAGGSMNGDSNPDGGRTYTPVNPATGANRCTTQELLINTIYWDVDKRWPIKLDIKPRSLCECDDFIIKVVKRGLNPPPKSTATGNGNEGATIPLSLSSSAVVQIYGWCDGQVEPHQCKGDAIFTITERPQ